MSKDRWGVGCCVIPADNRRFPKADARNYKLFHEQHTDELKLRLNFTPATDKNNIDINTHCRDF